MVDSIAMCQVVIGLKFDKDPPINLVSQIMYPKLHFGLSNVTMIKLMKRETWGSLRLIK